MLTLRSERLEAVVDPAHGGEVLSLRDRVGGASLLAATPFAPAAPRAGDLSEDDWTAATSDERGLARAIEAGRATWVESGRPVERRVTLHVAA